MSTWTDKRFKKMTTDIRQDMVGDGMDMSYSVLHEIAICMIDEEEGLKEFLESKGIVDTVGHLADSI